VRVSEDGCPSGVDTGRNVVHDRLTDVVLHIRRGVSVCDDLVVGEDDESLDSTILQADSFEDRAEEMSEMKWACRTLAREHSVLARLRFDLAAELRHPFKCGGIGIHM